MDFAKKGQKSWNKQRKTLEKGRKDRNPICAQSVRMSTNVEHMFCFVLCLRCVLCCAFPRCSFLAKLLVRQLPDDLPCPRMKIIFLVRMSKLLFQVFRTVSIMNFVLNTVAVSRVVMSFGNRQTSWRIDATHRCSSVRTVVSPNWTDESGHFRSPRMQPRPNRWFVRHRGQSTPPADLRGTIHKDNRKNAFLLVCFDEFLLINCWHFVFFARNLWRKCFGQDHCGSKDYRSFGRALGYIA